MNALGNVPLKRNVFLKAASLVLSLGAALFPSAGCSTLKDVPTTHIVMVNGRGNPVDPTGNFWCRESPAFCSENKQDESHLWFLRYPEMPRKSPVAMPSDTAATPASYANYLTALLDNLLEKAPKDEHGKRRILMFFHGGLNTQTGTVERAVKLQEAIAREGYYPVFINWQSSLFSSYGDHLVNVRQGESWDNWGWILTPFYFAGDVARAVARAPVVWYFQLRNDVENHKWITTKEQREANHIAAELAREYTAKSGKPAIAISYAPEDDRGNWEQAAAAFTGLITIPTKAVTSMVIDAFGKSAWDIMLRRTQMLYHTGREFLRSDEVAADYLGDKKRTSHIKPDGGLSVFMRQFQQVVGKNGGPDAWDITLVGHSMGTIVLNQMIRDFGDLPFNNIVYMAAATTVGDYEKTVFPYLKNKEKARMYHLTLHQKAEVYERVDTPIPFTGVTIPYFDIPPRGSLLVWIDDYLSNPEIPLDRTVGRFDNLMVAIHDTPDDLRGRISIKAFGVGNDRKEPQKHGDFTDGFTFWRPACWSARDQYPSDCYCP